MKTLILSCDTGEGHNSCAKAIAEEFLSRGEECEICEALHFLSEGAQKLITSGHTFMYRHTPKLYQSGYRFSENHPDMFHESSRLYEMFAKAALPLYEHIRDGGYDSVICVHLFPALMVTKILELYDPTLCTAFVATDYTCSPSVGDSRLGCCFIPAPSLAGEFVTGGISAELIVPSGIPIRPEFYTRAPKAEAKRSFGIEPSHQHLVAMTGSIGCGPLKELTETLAETMTYEQELTVVCGANEKLHRHLASRYAGQANIHILGFEKNVSLLLDSADLYLTKPGGISVTEAAAKALPMVLIDAIAAVEEYNLDFFTKAGAAVTAATPEELAHCCLELLAEPERRAEMSAAIAEAVPLNAAETIYETMCELHRMSIKAVDM